MKTPRTPRSAFTLIELLVVIAIISTLAGLLLVAVLKVWVFVPEVQARSDITGMSNAIHGFKAHFRVDFIPSKITVAKLASNSDPVTVAYLSRMYPQCVDTWRSPGISWNANDDGPTTLEGDQCLVFFLMGPIVDSNGFPRGWANNPKNPADPATVDRRIFFEFKQDRLIKRGTSKWYSYADPWKTVPYAYFSAQRSPNSYTGDCPTLTDAATNIVKPYGIGGVYQNPTSFQIICAGKDMKWGQRWGDLGGAGTTPYWTPTTSSTAYPFSDAGADDLSNFFEVKLGGRK